MSKIHWNTIYLEQLPVKLLTELIDHSYDLVVAKFPKKLRAAWEALPE
jgi:predicted DNA-binding protein (MmcQ/YjbR family)